MKLSDFIKQLQELERNGYGDATVVRFSGNRADYYAALEVSVQRASPIFADAYLEEADDHPAAIDVVLVR